MAFTTESPPAQQGHVVLKIISATMSAVFSGITMETILCTPLFSYARHWYGVRMVNYNRVFTIMDQPGMVASPARGQLNREKRITTPCPRPRLRIWGLVRSLPRVRLHRGRSPLGSSSNNGCCLFRYRHGLFFVRLSFPTPAFGTVSMLYGYYI